jgi:hypothetical protein
VLGRTVAVPGVASFFALLALAGAAAYQQQAAQQPPPRDPTEVTAAPAPVKAVARSPRNASYTITARLDPTSRTLTGEQLLT